MANYIFINRGAQEFCASINAGHFASRDAANVTCQLFEKSTDQRNYGFVLDAISSGYPIVLYCVLARIDKFSNLPVINFFFTVIKTKDQLFVRGIWGDEMREKARKSAV